MTAKQVLAFLQWMEGSGIDLATVDFRVTNTEGETFPLLGKVDVTMDDDPPRGIFEFRIP